jgi:hypothetical protein
MESLLHFIQRIVNHLAQLSTVKKTASGSQKMAVSKLLVLTEEPQKSIQNLFKILSYNKGDVC